MLMLKYRCIRPEGCGYCEVSVQTDGEQRQNGYGAEHDVTGAVDVAEDDSKGPAIPERVERAEGQHDQAEQ